MDANFDVLLIAIDNKEVAKGVKDDLMEMGVMEEKIIYPFL